MEDVDKLERKEMAVVYIIEVEKGNQEMDLYYSCLLYTSLNRVLQYRFGIVGHGDDAEFRGRGV